MSNGDGDHLWKDSGDSVDVSPIIVSDGLLKDTTAATGTYRFSGISNGRHTIIPWRKGLRSFPAALVVVVDGKHMSDQSFVCENIPPPTFNISGKIVSNGMALSGVVVTDSIYSARSDSAGHYIISGVSHGIHIITPLSGNLIFAPRTRRVVIDGNDVAGQDFQLLIAMTLINIPGGTFPSGPPIAMPTKGRSIR